MQFSMIGCSGVAIFAIGGMFVSSVALASTKVDSTHKPLSCLEKATSQEARIDCYANTVTPADDELNKVYQQVREKYQSNETLWVEIREAQRLWVQFRNAALKARYFESEDARIFPMCFNRTKDEMTRKRTEELREWLDGVPEGEVCAGAMYSRSAK